MKKQSKSTARSHRPALLVTTDQWHTADTAIAALRTALAPALQPLTESERRELLRVGVVNEAFTADYAALVTARPDIVPPVLQPAETARDWQTHAAIFERRREILLLAQELSDTLAALQADCYASALIGYRFLTQGGTPPGLDPAVEPLRQHWALRAERRRETRAKNLALKAAQEQHPPSTGGATSGNGATPSAAATVLPMSATSGASPMALAA